MIIAPSPFTLAITGQSNQPLLMENQRAAVLPNLKPAKPGHALVISKRQVPKIQELTAEELADTMTMVQNYQQLWQSLPENKDKKFDFSVYVNDGVKAGQTVPHVHFHVVPIDHAEPLPPSKIRSAIAPETVKHTLPKTPAELSQRMAKVYHTFSRNIDLVRAFAQKNGVVSRFTAIA